MLLQEQTKKNFLKRTIREYYRRKPLEEPTDLHKREIALESLEDSSYIRHLSFPYMETLYEYILNVKTPLHLYYSSAIYTHPNAPRMEDKIIEGAELLFDIDADKYAECEYKVWICPGTGSIHQSEPDKCENGGKPVEYTSVPWNCIERAWEDVLKLMDVLREDIGLSDIKVYFSGNRGFHVKVYDKKALLYDKDVRRSIAEYVSCSGINHEKLFPEYRGQVIFGGVEYGIRRRVLREALERGLATLKKQLAGLRDVYVVPHDQVQNVLNEICINVDKMVTIDTTRLSRFIRSLNMKSGLRTLELDPNKSIENWSYSSFSPFRGRIRLKSLVTAKLPVLDATIELKRGDIIDLESHLAIYLIVKNAVIPLDASDLEVKT